MGRAVPAFAPPPTRLVREREKAAAAVVPLDVGKYEPTPLTVELDACPDASSGRAIEAAGKSWQMDAKLWEGNFSESGRLVDYRVTHYPARGMPGFVVGGSSGAMRKLREANDRRTAKIREWGGDWFAYGDQPYGARDSPATQEYIPLIPGPYSRQQYWNDYAATSAKSFEAYHHDPIAHRSVELNIEFILGKGVEAQFDDEAAQAKWDAFWSGNNMDERLEQIYRNFGIFGESMMRWFPTNAGAFGGWIVRDLDPASIYEIVTDQEDLETVFFYHQQFSTPFELYAPRPQDVATGGAPTGPTSSGVIKYVVRQIPAEEVMHWKVNVTSAEKRGRPDIFPALGWIKRFRDLMTARVVKADMESRLVYLLKANATAGELRSLIASIFPRNQAPPPGQVVGLNNEADLTPFNFGSGGGDSSVGDDLDGLLNIIAIGVGVPKEYLGISSKGSRATALVATEPGARRFESRQKKGARILDQMADKVCGPQAKRKWIFPSIATEDRTAVLADLGTMEANGWISKQTAADTAAKSAGMDNFDWEREQLLIAEEFEHAGEDEQGDGVIRSPMISAVNRQARKLDPTKGKQAFEDDPPGLQIPEGTPGAAANGAIPPGTGAAAPNEQATRGGLPANENPLSSNGAGQIRQDNASAKEAGSVTLSASEFATLIREAAQRQPRRRPSDPVFTGHAHAFRDGTLGNVRDLIKDSTPGLSDGARAALAGASNGKAD